MHVRPGYKQTEVGVIPDEWDASRLQRASANITVGFVGSMAHLFVRDGVPLLRGQNILPQALDLSEHKFVSLATHQLWKKSALLPGDVAIVRVGYPGTACVIPVGLGELNAASLVLVRPDKSCIDSDYLACVLNSSWGKRQIGSLLVGGAQQVFNTRTAAAFMVPLPPLPEQRAIAAALSDVDALLGGLDRLIAKKRDLKQAAMQQLLTGQTRLPGFSGAWEVKRLGEIGSTYGGLTGKTKADFGIGTGRYVTFMNVMANVVIDCGSFERVRVLPSESQNRVNEGDLLFNGSSETPEEVAMCSFMASDVPGLFLNSFCFGFRRRDERQADGLFLAYYLRANPGRELMKSLAQGSTRYNLSKGALLEASIRLPLKDEQTAIAAVLSDMDAELAALGARRNKTRALKQAMMQILLTGRIRLVESDVQDA